MGTPQTMRRPSSVSAKGTLRKSAVLTVKQLSPQIGEITGVKRNCFPKNLQVLCRSPRMSFFYPCPGISPQRRQAHIFAQSYPIRTVIQFLICPSIGSQREGPKINPVCKFFEQCLQRQKEPVHSTSNQREMISRHIFDETMYRLCYSETFNVCYFRSAGRLCNRSGGAAISFGGCLVFHFRYSVVDSAMRVEYSIAYRTLVRQWQFEYAARFSKSAVSRWYFVSCQVP